MARTGARKRFVEVNERLNAHIHRDEREQAQALLSDLIAVVEKVQDPIAAKRMRDVIAFHEERIARMSRRRASLADIPGPQPNPKRPDRPLNATCALCRSAFHREAEDRTKVCDVCRPPTQRSVRTVSGGLPGTGKRR